MTTPSTESPRTSYLTGVVKPATLEHAHRPDFGVLITPDTKSYRKHIDAFGGTWAADNACFTQTKAWREDLWRKFLGQMTPWADTCLWATVPDVVGSHEGTVARFGEYAPVVREHGYRVAFVVQNGATPENVPWGEFDAMFIGGVPECLPCGWARPAGAFQIKRCPECGRKLTEWKESEAALALVRAAQAHGKPIHMGRVNSGRRMAICAAWGIDTADGTYIRNGDGAEMTAAVVGWLDEANGAERQPELPLGVAA